MEEEKKKLKKFPYKEMMELGWIKKCETDFETVIELRKFFEVVSLNLIKIYIDETLTVFYQKVKLESRNIDTKVVNKDRIREDVPILFNTNNLDELKQTLEKLGVALVVLPCIKKNTHYDISFKNNNKIVIGLTDCDKDELYFNLSKKLNEMVV